MNYRRLATVQLTDPLSDPKDRGLMPMSTIFDSDQWLVEVSWDGAVIGDAQVFKNENASGPSVRTTDRNGDPLPFAWVWWAGVPRGKIKSYRFMDADKIQPQTLPIDALPFELPNAQRKTEPRQVAKAGPAPA